MRPVFALLVIAAALPLLAADPPQKKTAAKKPATVAPDPQAKNPIYTPPAGPLPDRRADEALAGLDVADGLAATLFAAEPMILNPSCLDIDARGRVWVGEVVNYRVSLRKDHPIREAGDRILILQDDDGDGKADRIKTYYQGRDIDSLHGVCVLGNRLIVSTPTQIIEFVDDNADDKPDRKTVRFIAKASDHDHALHTFNFGVDGRLYFNTGNDTRLLMTADGNPVTDTLGRVVETNGKPFREGMVFRTRLDFSGLEVLGWNFRNNWEVNIDSFGTLWQSDNDDDGNQGVRINYVMPGGNYGYKDELTGAAWKTPRTNLEPEIPRRHWHLNDPGVVPNLLLTGAGSPTGLCVYEGTLLPKIFHGQIIHCDAGPNVVRAYPVQPEGAGYSASIVPILTGSRDKWFRPSDVVVAPDGSLIVADWYDPGVGGHRQGDLDRGRLFRVAPPAASYHAPALDLSSARGAIAALLSPNRDAMYQGWIALEHLKPAAVPALAEVWKTASDPRHRARALHVLARLDPAGDWAARAAADADPDLRIVAIRIARDLDSGRLIGFLKPLASDASPAVRREVALAMRDLKSPGVPALWAALAQRHDGNDRWYLEALGIAAAGHDEACFQAWIEHVRGDWNTPAGRDIVWRSRAPQAVELLGKIIADPAVTAADRPRYFRAFDFHVGPAKQSTLSELLKVQGPHQDQVVALTLKHLDGLDLNTRPELKPIVARVLNNLRGTQEYVDLVDRLNLTDHNEALLAMIVAKPQDAASIEAARVLIRRKGASLLAAALADDARAASVARVLAVSGDKNLLDMVGPVIHDARRPLPIRSAALRAYAAGFQQQRDVLNWIKAGKLSPDLHAVAADLLFGSVKEDVRAEAAQYLQAPAAPGGKPLPPIAELARRAGNPDNGKAVYARSCVACHQIEGQGIDFGPALTEIGSKLPKEDLYVSILNPSAGISFGFEGWIIKLQDGNEMLGYIASETADTLTLKLMGGIPVKYAKSQIVSRTKQDQSLMTPGLHLAMTEQELVDLVEYLASLKKK